MDEEDQEQPVVLDGIAPFAGEPIDRSDAERLASVLKALADPVRLRIISLIGAAEEPPCVTDLLGPLGLAQPTVSHHLRILRVAGLVTREKHGVFTVYWLNTSAIGTLADLLAPPRKRPPKRRAG